MEIDGEPLDLQPGASGLVLYPDRAANFEAWDIDRQALCLGEKVGSPGEISVERDASGLRGAIIVARPVGQASRVAVRYELESASRVLRNAQIASRHGAYRSATVRRAGAVRAKAQTS